jgi:hypothetical protein
MHDPMKDGVCVPVPPTGRNADRREPKSYTRGPVAMIGKKHGYKAARRSTKVWLDGWRDELDAGNRDRGGRR